MYVEVKKVKWCETCGVDISSRHGVTRFCINCANVRHAENLKRTRKKTMENEMVMINKLELEELRRRDEFLMCLEEAGVDNWDGYDEAMKILNGEG